MKFSKLFKLRSKSKKKPPPEKDHYRRLRKPCYDYEPAPVGQDRDAHPGKLPVAVLEKIFAQVCPHSHDETYDAHEDSDVVGACAMCDLRDLAHCAAVSKRWREAASNVL